MRKVYLLPNMVTTANMGCGFYSIVMAIQGDIVTAAWAILAAAIFDMLDGRIARMAKATSQFGVEYDSLSDLVSFGVAPAVLLYQWSLSPYGRFGWLAAFTYLVCAALRLARFNVSTASLPKGFFQGLPSPMAAGMTATFMIFDDFSGWLDRSGGSFWNPVSVALCLSVGVGALMVSNFSFPSFKELNWRSRASFGFLVLGVLALVMVAIRPEVFLFAILCTYVVSSLSWNAWRALRGLPRATAVAKAAPEAVSTTEPRLPESK